MAAAGKIASNVQAYLLTVSAITDVVSTRIYPSVLPQSADPAKSHIVYQVVSGSSTTHLTGASKHGQTVVQIDCYAPTFSAAEDLELLVWKNLTHYTGAAGSDTIDVALPEDGSHRQLIDRPQDGSDEYRFRHGRDYLIHHSQPAVST